MRVDPRLRVLYLAGVGVAAFLLRAPWQVGLLLAVQVGLWFAVRLPARQLLRRILKLWGLTAFVIVSYALVADTPATDRWVHIDLLLFRLPINIGGASAGALMVLRVIAVILASQVARAGDPRAIAAGLGKLGAPPLIAGSIDAVLALFGDGGGHRHGSGMGGGRGRGRGGGGGGRGAGGGGRGGDGGQRDGEAPASPPEGLWATLRGLGRGNVGGIAHNLERHIDRAAAHAERNGIPRERARDVGAVAGLALTMLGVRALKILPNLPFAPGHKLVLLTPLYVVAQRTTRTRLGATATGLTMGVVSFLMGDGKYGPFEILKHMAPGVMCDLLLPWLAPPSRRLGPVAWSLIGGLIAAGRFATIFAVALLVQTPAVAFAFLLPGMAIHMTFGFLSGYITWQLLRATAAASSGQVAHPDADAGAPAPNATEAAPAAGGIGAPPIDPLREPHRGET